MESEQDLISRALSTVAKKRWQKTKPKERSAIAQEISNARWEKWRAENPEKAAASEARRAKRAAAAKKAAKKKGST
jgi:transcription elongation GreA/GreB family factor